MMVTEEPVISRSKQVKFAELAQRVYVRNGTEVQQAESAELRAGPLRRGSSRNRLAFVGVAWIVTHIYYLVFLQDQNYYTYDFMGSALLSLCAILAGSLTCMLCATRRGRPLTDPAICGTYILIFEIVFLVVNLAYALLDGEGLAYVETLPFFLLLALLPALTSLLVSGIIGVPGRCSVLQCVLTAIGVTIALFLCDHNRVFYDQLFVPTLDATMALIVTVEIFIRVIPSGIAGRQMVGTFVVDVILRMASAVGGSARKWRAIEWSADLIESPKPTRYAFGILRAAMRMRLSDLADMLRRAVCWMLATETRTWTPLTILLLWGGLETSEDTGLGAAILAVVGAGAVFQQGVRWLRGYLGVQVEKRKKKPE
ncbi:hypothetical protein [Sphaerisporangium rhizosphaerae]|uniref:Uncharacterized protein n=1 Tax=Sphaerisporangium rhizosphaerae TaxID=2269375 RepID=A0ABW2NU19_9ACTN